MTAKGDYAAHAPGSSSCVCMMQDSKCSWLIVQALQRASAEQRSTIEVSRIAAFDAKTSQ